jgi:hypothetical protein
MATDQSSSAEPATAPPEAPPAPERPIPEFLREMDPPKFVVLLNTSQTNPRIRLVQCPISLQQLMLEADEVGPPSQVLVMVPQNPEGM